MSPEQPDSREKADIQIRPGSGLARIPGGGSPALSEIMDRSIVHIQTSKALATRHRIGGHELCGPDYRLVCAWAEDLQLTPEDILMRLLNQSDEMETELNEHYGLGAFTDNEGRRTRIVDGHFKSLLVVRTLLPISELPSIEGLIVERFTLLGGKKSYQFRLPEEAICLDLSILHDLVIFDCRGVKITKLDISSVPNLAALVCGWNHLIDLDLSNVPNLKILYCYANDLIELDLSAVPELVMLGCWYNRLTSLDLSNVPNLRDLNCDDNQLTALDLSAVLNLTKLSCDDNNITSLNLSAVPKLTEIWCDRNQLSELDVRELMNLEFVICLNEKTRIIKRPDQSIG